MSPEQAEGWKLLDHRTDIYSLGLVLYELVTLRPAFDQADRRALLRQIIEVEPPLPRRIEPSVPKDLQTIILKCIAKQPRDRYASAAEPAENLQRFVENKPVQARRVGPAYRLLRWTQRNRVVSGLVAAVLVLLSAPSVAGPLFTHKYMRIASAEAACGPSAERAGLPITVTCLSNVLGILSWLVWCVTRGASSAGQRSFRARAIASSRYERFRYWPDGFCESPFRQVPAGAS